MKFTKRIFLAVALGLAICLGAATPALAQNTGLYTLIAGGTATLPGGSTNTIIAAGVTNQYGGTNFSTITSSNLTQAVSEYDWAGLTFSAICSQGATNSLVGLKIFRSYNNGVTYEGTANWNFTFTNAGPGLATVVIATNLYIPGVTHLGFSLEAATSGTLAYESNVLLQVNLKSIRLSTQQAGNSSSSTPGSKPITVPNFP